MTKLDEKGFLQSKQEYFLFGVEIYKKIKEPEKKKYYVFGIKYWERRFSQEILFTGTYSYQSHYENNEKFLQYKTDIKTICYYLPQFHQIPENDKWWGKGFTEWSNVLPAQPRFERHYQPRLPHKDFGTYDLSDVNSFKKQVELARQHGIYGFCFYYYWFSGKKLLETPIENLLKHKEIDMSFCICWANENWTKTWSGEEEDVLMKQKYKKNDALKFIQDIKPILKDIRYIKNSNKPIILVYKVFLIPNPNETFKIWREYCRKNVIGKIEIWLVRSHSVHGGIRSVNETFRDIDHDNEVEFPPHIVCTPVQSSYYDEKNDCYGINYKEMSQRVLLSNKYPKETKIVRAAMFGWDNTARHAFNTAHIYMNFSLYDCCKWMKYIIEYTRKKFAKDNRFIFINAWNEWTEGCYLEPDERYGYANINTLSRAIFDLPFEEKIPENAIVVILLERFGDIIACEPVIRYLKDKYPDKPVYWVSSVQYQDIFRYHPDVAGFMSVYSKEQYQIWHSNLSSSNMIINLHFHVRYYDIFDGDSVENSNLATITDTNYFDYGQSLLEIFSKVAGIEHLNVTPKFYRRPSENQYKLDIEGQYIAIHTVSKEECKDWTKDKWEELIKFLIQDGYKIVEVGSSSIGIKNIDGLINKIDLSIQDTADIIARASCLICVDSGLAHLANALNIKGIILQGKYKQWEKYSIFSGNYQKGINSKIIYAQKGFLVKDIPVAEVYNTVVKLVTGI